MKIEDKKDNWKFAIEVEAGVYIKYISTKQRYWLMSYDMSPTPKTG